jgi:hypothetical protein
LKKKAATTEAGAEEASAQPTGRTHQKMGQIIMLAVVALDGYYAELLGNGHPINPTPSWEPIEFSPQVDEAECARHLAARGVGIAEANDARDYAFTWLTSAGQTEPDVQLSIAINRYLGERRMTSNHTTGWSEHLQYYYERTLARWLPILPLAGSSSSAPRDEPPAYSAGILPPSSSVIGNHTPQPPTTTSAPPTSETMVTNAGLLGESTPADDNVEMTQVTDEEMNVVDSANRSGNI